MGQQPVLLVLLYSTLAALSAALGALPFVFRAEVAGRSIGVAYALASGLMLGAGYLLMNEALTGGPLWAVGGAALGVGYTWGTQAYAGTEELHRDAGAVPDDIEYGYKIILQNTLHSASEGLAIGVSMAVKLPLGVFMALALAIHNVGEATALTSLLRKRGLSTAECAGLCVATNSTQVLVAVAAFALSLALAPWLPVALGAAAGAMVFLVMTELLPSGYRRSRKATVALLVSASAGVVVLLEDFFV